MSKKVHSVPESENLSNVTKLMSKRNIGSVIVMRGGAPVGIVTERDIVKQLGAQGNRMLELTAGNVASKPLVTIVPETAMLDAFAIMLDHKTRRLPVVKNGELLGIVTERDLFRWVKKVSKSRGVPISMSTAVLAATLLATFVAHSGIL